MNAYFFSLLGRVCGATEATSYSQAWDRTVGTNGQAVALTVAIKTGLSCLAYSMILADSFQSLAVAAGLEDVSRTSALLAVTVTALLPLCLQRDLSSLAPFSLFGLLGFGVAVVTMVTRCIDGSYGSGGAYLADLPPMLQPTFGDVTTVLLPDAHGAVLLCTLATAFVAHYNAPRFHTELRDKEEFNTVVSLSFEIATALFVVVAVAGFVTFGNHAQPFVLNNYSPFDPLAAASRAAVASSIFLTFPLPFVGLRDGILDALPGLRSDLTLVSVALLGAITVAAIAIHDLSLVLAVGGGTFSTAVSSVFPALMFRSLVQNQHKLLMTNSSVLPDGEPKAASQNEFDANVAFLLMTVSVVIGLAGVSIALTQQMYMNELPSDYFASSFARNSASCPWNVALYPWNYAHYPRNDVAAATS